jgi:hypothetical protein
VSADYELESVVAWVEKSVCARLERYNFLGVVGWHKVEIELDWLALLALVDGLELLFEHLLVGLDAKLTQLLFEHVRRFVAKQIGDSIGRRKKIIKIILNDFNKKFVSKMVMIIRYIIFYLKIN